MSSSPATQKRTGAMKKLRRKKRSAKHAGGSYVGEEAEPEEEHTAELLDTFASLLNNELLSDVHFIVGRDSKIRIPAHRLVLSARSEVFERMLYGPMKEGAAHVDIDVPDLDDTCFMNLLRFVYTAKAELAPETAMGTLYAAKKYGVQGLRSSCVKYLQQLLNVRNACMMYSQALLFDEIELQSQCLGIIESNGKDVLTSVGFTEMPLDCLKTVVASDQLRTNEINIFRACVAWAEAECARQRLEVSFENKRRVLSDVIPLIRFPLISSVDVAEEVVDSGVLSAEELVQLFSYLCAQPGKQPQIPFLCKPRIKFLVIGTDWAHEVMQMIAASAAVSVEAINPNIDEPALSLLVGYGAILVFSSSAFTDSEELGDALADYVDQGGGVVIAAIAGDSDAHGVGGRFEREEYHAMKRGERCHDSRHQLGKKLIPSHPILEGIQSFDGGPQSWRVRSTASPGARIIAEWEDGVPIAVEKVIHERPCSISLNIWPPSRNISKDGWETFTDGCAFLINALMYVSQA